MDRTGSGQDAGHVIRTLRAPSGTGFRTALTLTDNQRAALEALCEHGSEKLAAHALGISIWSLGNRLGHIRAKSGLATVQLCYWLGAMTAVEELASRPKVEREGRPKTARPPSRTSVSPGRLLAEMARSQAETPSQNGTGLVP